MTEDDLHRQRVDRGGIHCVRANESRNLLACSGGRNEDHTVYVLNLKSRKWATVRRGTGHRDWVFTLNWISDSTFVTGSRDTTVMLWQPGRDQGYDMKPVAVFNEHNAKVLAQRVRTNISSCAAPLTPSRHSNGAWAAVCAGPVLRICP